MTDVTAVGDASGTEVGAKRILNDVFHETLHELDESSLSFRYSIDDGPGPVCKDSVAGYVGEVKVLPITVPATPDQCLVVWTSTWVSEEGGVSEFCDPIYTALLTDMKNHFG